MRWEVQGTARVLALDITTHVIERMSLGWNEGISISGFFICIALGLRPGWMAVRAGTALEQ